MFRGEIGKATDGHAGAVWLHPMSLLVRLKRGGTSLTISKGLTPCARRALGGVMQEREFSEGLLKRRRDESVA